MGLEIQSICCRSKFWMSVGCLELQIGNGMDGLPGSLEHMVAPLEFKTGKPHHSHKAQVSQPSV